MKWIILTILGVAVGYWLGRKRLSSLRANGVAVNPEQIEQKKENLEKVFELAKNNSEITNDLVEKSLGVSNSTAERYLQELEQQGRLVQVGTTGKYVVYKAI